MLAAEVCQLLLTLCAMQGDLFPKTSERAVHPYRLISFFIENRYNAQFWQLCFPLVGDPDDNQVMFSCQRLEPLKIILIDKVRDHNYDASAFNEILGKCYGVVQICLQ